MSAHLESLLRARIEEALAARRDPTTAALSALMEHQGNLTPNAQNLLREVRRVEIHRGAENRYRIQFQHEDDVAFIELTQKELAKNAEAFNERYLAAFSRIPRWGRGEWPGFVEAVLHHETVEIMAGREDVNEEVLAVEGFVERAQQRWRPTRDLHQSLRDEDKVWWESETGHVLVRSERVNRYLKSSGYTVSLERFGYVLKERGVVIRESFQRKVPPKDGVGKVQNLHFWRLNAAAIGWTEADILDDVLADLPPEPDTGAAEGAG